MNTLALHRRGRWEGALQIVRYNWPRYAAGVAAIIGAGALVLAAPLPTWAAAVLWMGLGLAAWWTVASVLVSHWVYDRSPMYRWDWLPPLLGPPARRWVNIHAGLDESSEGLARILARPPLAVLDIYHPAAMTEPSIARARAEQAQRGLAVGLGDWPRELAGLDAVFLVFCAHEVRDRAARSGLLARARRRLAPGGRVVVVEHLRDAANFAAFGPGFTHFLSRREWLRTFGAAGLRVAREAAVTPFVRAFILEGTP